LNSSLVLDKGKLLLWVGVDRVVFLIYSGVLLLPWSLGDVFRSGYGFFSGEPVILCSYGDYFTDSYLFWIFGIRYSLAGLSTAL
jgi:hypothetical protein